MLARPVARIDFGGVRDPQRVDILDPKSGLFLTSPPYPPTKTPFLAHFVTKSGPFGRFGGGASHPPHPPGYGPDASILTMYLIGLINGI